VTVRRAGASPQRSADVDVASALRQGREALLDIQGQLDALLATLRQPGAAPDPGAAERLRGATRQAGSALSSLTRARDRSAGGR
jgi:hypothetical protein